MSNDLISRKQLMSHIEDQHREWGEDYDAEQILGDIEDMPSAYNVDKVVEALKKEFKEYYGNNWDKAPYLAKAIEIVKLGIN